MNKFVCTKCSYEHVASELTEDFVCPECGATSEDFEDKIQFKNRKAFNINRKILNIEKVFRKENGELDSLIVTVERGDEPKCYPNNSEAYYAGTPLEANALNEIITAMIKKVKEESEKNNTSNNQSTEE